MINHELEALLQGALDDTLTPDEREQLARMIAQQRGAGDRAAELTQLATLIDSLGPADAPPDLVNGVLAQVARHPSVVRPFTFQRGINVNKKILFGLAAAAAIFVGVITYNTYPPATVGTEATIGAAQRAQAPQIAASDVKLGDTSAQDVLQTALWDQLAKDEDLRTALQDENFRNQLMDAELRQSLSDASILRALRDPSLAKNLQDQAMVRQLNDPGLVSKLSDENLRMAMTNRAFASAIRNQAFRSMLTRNATAAALASPAFQNALKNQLFAKSLSDPRFAAHMRGMAVR